MRPLCRSHPRRPGRRGVTRPFLRLLVTVLLRLTCLLAVVTLALAVGFAAGWNAHITLATSSHHRWMPLPVPGDLALYDPPQSSPTLPGVEESAGTGVFSGLPSDKRE